VSYFLFNFFSFCGFLRGWIKREMLTGNRFTLDLFEKMPYHSLSNEERHEIWDDGLHFTAAGYAKIGSLVAERLIEIINAEDE
jgi:lysophospholipase L1-like esterase